MTPDPYDLSDELPGLVVPKGDSHLRAEARLTVGADGVTATTEGGETYLVPWKGIRLGRNDGSVTVQAADRSASITSQHPDFMRALETAGGNDLNDALSRLAGDRVSHPLQHKLGCLAVLIAIPLAIWGAWRLFHGAVDATVDAMPYSVDEAIGESVWGEMDLGGPKVEDETVDAAIQTIVDRLQPYSEIPEAEFTFAVVDKDIANAFALPGGYMVVYTGLILRADSPEQVAGVMAHEMAHVTHRHGMRRIAHSVGLMAGLSLLFGNVDALSGMALKLFQLGKVNSYSQDQETDADIEGAEMLIAARIDPRGLAEFFEMMKAEYGDVPDALAWTSTHPQHDARVAAILAYEREHGEGVEYEPIDVDWDAVCAALGATEEDPSEER
jgi:Zn-dependent protease with chaperone function